MSEKLQDRLQSFLTSENISQAQFADELGVVRASVSHLLGGRNNPGYDFTVRLINKYPKLNIEWLLAGKGKMYREPESAVYQPQQTGIQSDPISLFDMNEDDASSSARRNAPDSVSVDLAKSAGAVSNATNFQQSPMSGNELPRENPTARQSQISQPDVRPQADMQFSETFQPTQNSMQPIGNQRKITKILVFYDDNSFQEIG